MDAQLSTQARDHLARIRNGSLKMATLIDDLLAYSHIDRRGLQSSIVVACRSWSIRCVRHYADEVQRRHVALVGAGGADYAARRCRRHRARTAQPVRERAEVHAASASMPRIDITRIARDLGVLLSVADNGIGFDMEYHDHIFKIFQRLHRDDQYPGTGIGLALVRKAVERIGGRVWAESRARRGRDVQYRVAEVCDACSGDGHWSLALRQARRQLATRASWH